MQAACLETIHTAHDFTELNRGLYSGTNKKNKTDGWKDHILAAEDEPEVKTVVNYFQPGWSTRMESASFPRRTTTAAAASTCTAWTTSRTSRRSTWKQSCPQQFQMKRSQHYGATCLADRMVAATVGGPWRMAPRGGIRRQTWSGYTTRPRTRRTGTKYIKHTAIA